MYRRPNSVSHPTTWHTFEAAGLDGKPTTYEIRDLIDEDLEQAVDMMTIHFIKDEPQSKILKLLDDPGSVEDCRVAWRKTQLQKLPIVCYDTKTGEIVGANFLAVTRKDDPKEHDEHKGIQSKWIFGLYDWILTQFDGFEFFGADEYIYEYGLGTHSDYRGRGIATELLKARRPLMKALGIKNSLTVFSAIGSQKAGEKAGYITQLEYK